MKLIKDLGSRHPNVSSKQKKRYGIFECPRCKKHVEAQTYKVTAGQMQCNSCARKTGKKHKVHGLTGTRIFTTYVNMRQRCENPNHNSYKSYGQRGISVCKEWQEDSDKFFKWAMENGYSDSLTIDRKDCELGYFPENCRFVDRSAQAQNRRKQAGTRQRFIGVHRKKGESKFCSRVMVKGYRHFIGKYETDIEAAIARDRFILDNGLVYFKLNLLSRSTEDD